MVQRSGGEWRALYRRAHLVERAGDGGAPRLFGFVGTLPLFVAAGAIMAPTVLAGGLARHRSDWPTSPRRALAVVASSTIVVVAWQVHRDWRLPVIWRAVAIVFTVVVVALPMISLGLG